jgi:peptide/nickel transport system substrate-binding protein
MNRKIAWLALSCLMVLSLVLASCGPAVEEEEEEGKTVVGKVTEVEEEEEEEEEEGYIITEVGKPIYGGTGVFFEASSPTAWDPGYLMHVHTNASAYLEGLIMADWTRGPQGTNEFPFDNQTVPAEYITGLMAESWELADDYTIIYHLRQNIRYVSNNPAVPGNGREVVAEDWVYAMERAQASPRSRSYKAEGTDDPNYVYARAIDKYTLEITVPTPILSAPNIDGPYPQEAVEAYGDLEDWRNAIGTGPWILTDFVPDSSRTYVKNEAYWRNDPLRPEYRLPYMDGYRVIVIPDPATQLSAIRTRKILTYGCDWEKAEMLKETNPELQWVNRPANYNVVIFFRNDIEPFSDIRVRKALAIAINRQEILDDLMKGNGTMLAWPVWSSVGEDIYVPLEELPPDIKELYEYDPAKAKQYLTEAGYPNGFPLELLTPNAERYIDRATIVKTYWDAIGVPTTVNVIEPGTFYPLLYGKNYQQSNICAWGNSSEWSCLGWCWRTDILYNYGKVSDPKIDEAWQTARETTDVAERNKILHDIYLYGMAQAWDICLPQPIDYVFFQPYMHGYAGEYAMLYEPMQTHVWIDPVLQKQYTGR